MWWAKPKPKAISELARVSLRPGKSPEKAQNINMLYYLPKALPEYIYLKNI
jgi:hypothetical protein